MLSTPISHFFNSINQLIPAELLRMLLIMTGIEQNPGQDLALLSLFKSFKIKLYIGKIHNVQWDFEADQSLPPINTGTAATSTHISCSYSAINQIIPTVTHIQPGIAPLNLTHLNCYEFNGNKIENNLLDEEQHQNSISTKDNLNPRGKSRCPHTTLLYG